MQRRLRHRIQIVSVILKELSSTRGLPSLRRIIIACMGFPLAAGFGGAVSATPTSDLVATRTASAMYALQTYQTSRSLDDLRSAIEKMRTASNFRFLTVQNFIVQRRTVVSGWLQILKAIDSAYDPSFDPADRKNFLIWDCHPWNMQDPKEESLANLELEENQQKTKRWSYYHEVYDLDRHATTLLSMILEEFRSLAPEGTPSDFAALHGIVQRAGLSAARRTAIDAMFHARSE